jgi:adenylate cyclase
VIVGLFWWQPWTDETQPALVERPTDLPAIAVLPFENMSGDPEQDYFSDGITEDLITDLSRISGLFVIARSTVFTYKDRAVTVRQVGDELGVRYVLEGSVRKSGNRVRINAQLIDVRSEQHLWADRYDRELTEVFALQDEVTEQIVSALAVKLTTDEEERFARASQVDPDAYDTLLRGLELFRRYSKETNAEAREYFERAIAIDPNFARAHADLALTLVEDVTEGWSDAPEASLRQAMVFAQKALTIDDSVPQVHFALSNIFLDQRRYDESIDAARKSIALDPNFADGYVVMAAAFNYAGEPDAAIAAMQKAIRLNPRQPFWYPWTLGQAQFLLKRFEEAIRLFEDVINRNPSFPLGHLALATAYAQVGRIEDAEWEVQEVLSLLPGYSMVREQARAVYKNEADLELWMSGLRKAGLPER